MGEFNPNRIKVVRCKVCFKTFEKYKDRVRGLKGKKGVKPCNRVTCSRKCSIKNSLLRECKKNGSK
jgi:hypothetical protein